jgi:hypothetical protein
MSMFLRHFAAIKAKLDEGDSASAIELVPVLAALLKENLMIGIEQCVPMGFAEKRGVRAVFLAAVASVFRVPEAKVIDAEEAPESGHPPRHPF